MSTSQANQSNANSNKKKNLIALAVFGLFAIVFGMARFHVITGGSLDFPRVVMKDSIGFKETFINVDEITGMPWVSAMSRYPIGVRVLQRENIIESNEERKQRHKEEFDKEMKDLQNEMQKQFEY